jgi:glycosyltransferase involved in cell wall biosynthesis
MNQASARERPPAEAEICVGIPVYNGAKTLARVLENLTAQTYRDLLFVISDNGSTDATAQICAEWVARDPRIRYFRQPATIPATDNFKFVLGKCRAPFFMWAAHDDFRDLPYVEKLLAALRARPDAILAFGDVTQYTDGRASKVALRFETAGCSPGRRLRWAALSQLHHLYGLWRTAALRRIDWRHVDWWHDTPLMMAASQLGEFVHVPGVTFHYNNTSHPFFARTDKQGRLAQAVARARDMLLLIWHAGRTVGEIAGPWRGFVATFWVTVRLARDTSGFVWRRSAGRLARKGG